MTRTSPEKSPSPASIARIVRGSIAEEVELLPGDLLLAVNGVAVSDYIAYRFAIAEEEVTLEVARGEERWAIEIEKEIDDDLGIVFAEDLFDGVRACRNNCVFCFENQMPAGMRPSLRLRDDDFRLAFLHGNFLSLTNLKPEDFSRIFRERLTPLYVSIHATDPVIRRAMLRNSRAPEILPLLRRLGRGGIQVHGQIVLCPGWNDGAALARTLQDLSSLYPTVLTVGVVPVGLSEHRPAGPEVRAVTPEDAAAALEIIAAQQAVSLCDHNTRLVFAADEFYFLAGRSIPPREEYEEFAQQENGIGLARLFLDELDELGTLPSFAGMPPVTLATGTLAAPLLELLAEKLRAAGLDARVTAVSNRFYGGNVSVAGLLTGQDILADLRGCVPGSLLILPAATLNADGIFLDDMTPVSLSREVGAQIEFCAGPREVVERINSQGYKG